MKQSIKVTPEQRQEMFKMKRPGEDYSDVLQRLLNLNNLLTKAEPLIEGSAEYWRVKSGTKQGVSASLRPGDSA